MLGKYIIIVITTLLMTTGYIFSISAIKTTAYNEGYDAAMEVVRVNSLDLLNQQQNKIDEVTKDAEKRINQAHADAVAARATSDGLRKTLGEYNRRRKSSNASGASTSESEKLTMLSELLVSADERAGALAEIADEAIERGLTCERSYDALSAGMKN
jgi:hypothetical protein